MSTTTEAPAITQLEMSEADIEFAERMAERLGYTQTAYTSTSALWGLFCLPDRPKQTRRKAQPEPRPKAPAGREKPAGAQFTHERKPHEQTRNRARLPARRNQCQA